MRFTVEGRFWPLFLKTLLHMVFYRAFLITGYLALHICYQGRIQDTDTEKGQAGIRILIQKKVKKSKSKNIMQEDLFCGSNS